MSKGEVLFVFLFPFVWLIDFNKSLQMPVSSKESGPSLQGFPLTLYVCI